MTRIENTGFLLALFWFSKGSQPCLMCVSIRFSLKLVHASFEILAVIF